MNWIKFILIVIIIMISGKSVFSQIAPAVDENIPYLVTFGANSSKAWGDDDFCQVFFCIVPNSHTAPIYIRVFDPDTGGDIDELKDKFNTIVNFSVYAGKSSWSEIATHRSSSKVNYKSGYLLSAKSFGVDSKYNKKWYSFGPFNPAEGEYVEQLGGRVFKIIAQGISGNDGNLYKYFLSKSPVENIAVEGGNFFTYKYHFRLSDNQKHISQIYPYIDNETISIEISNFDWDSDGKIRIFSNSKNGVNCDISGQNNWNVKKFPIVAKERNSTIEVQFIKSQALKVLNNNVVVTVKNQYGTSMPFFVLPIGGVPVYSPKIGMK